MPYTTVGAIVICKRCQEPKVSSDFYSNARRSINGRLSIYSTCKACSVEINRENIRKRYGSSRNQQIYTRYNLTADQYNAILAHQDNKCPLCKKRKPKAVDHDHQTGHIRGILCSPCNSALAVLGDNPEGLRRALDYVSATIIPDIVSATPHELPPKRGWNKYPIPPQSELAEKYANGSLKTLSNFYKVSPGTVLIWLKFYDIKRKPQCLSNPKPKGLGCT